jgi:predicted metal-dependent hydrolase
MAHFTVGGIRVELVRKPIKNLHLGVYPPAGRVRVAAPPRISDEAVRLAVVTRLGWIKRQRQRFLTQERESRRDFVTGETHYFLGIRHRLSVVAGEGVARVVRKGHTRLVLTCLPGLSRTERGEALERWYRRQLRAQAEPLLAKWSERLGVSADFLGIKRMRTKWGSCNPDTRRVWLNLELVKKPRQCLEYLIVHELLHLRVRQHNEAFLKLTTRHYPACRAAREALNRAPLGHEEWEY